MKNLKEQILRNCNCSVQNLSYENLKSNTTYFFNNYLLKKNIQNKNVKLQTFQEIQAVNSKRLFLISFELKKIFSFIFYLKNMSWFLTFI